MKTILSRLQALTVAFTVLLVLFGRPDCRAEDVVEKWVQRYSGPGNDTDEAKAVVVDGSGNVVVAGYSAGSGSNLDYYTAKYAAPDGALLWEKRYNGTANSSDGANAVAVDGSGNVVVTGFSYGSGSSADYYTAKYAAGDGALLWEKRYNGTGNDYDEARAVAVDGSGNVVVTGDSVGSGGTRDYYTAKYAAANGALLWEKRYNGTANGNDVAYAVAVDGSGNVVVTGESFGGGSNNDYYTAKYAAANGALLWEKRYNGTANSADRANAVAVDGSGNVVVTGYSAGSGGEVGQTLDYYTAKYAAGDGALLWERRYNGTANSADVGYAVAVDGSGNVVVTGKSDGSGSISDYYTAKYAAGDGALLWEKRYNGPGNNLDEARAVAVDGSGNLVVTGYSLGSGGNSDYYTAKYAAADGALLWEKLYNGPANRSDFARAVAVDGSGNVVITGYSSNGSSNDYATVFYAPGPGEPEIVVEQPALSDVPDGGSRVIPTVILGNTGVITFTIRNTGPGVLNGLTITKDGPDAGRFLVTTSPVAPVNGPAGSTTFTVAFTPTTSGQKTAALHIANDDADENPFDITLTGRGLSVADDTDGDGLNDVAEAYLAHQGFDWQVSQPALVSGFLAGTGLFTQPQYNANYTAGQSSVTGNPNAFSLYTLTQVQELNVGIPVVVRDPVTGKFKLTIRLQSSSNLTNFQPLQFTGEGTVINGQGQIEFEFTPPSVPSFYRLKSK